MRKQGRAREPKSKNDGKKLGSMIDCWHLCSAPCQQLLNMKDALAKFAELCMQSWVSQKDVFFYAIKKSKRALEPHGLFVNRLESCVSKQQTRPGDPEGWWPNKKSLSLLPAEVDKQPALKAVSQEFLHTNTFAHRSFYKKNLVTQKSFHTHYFAQRNFYTQKFSPTEHFTQSSFYEHPQMHTEKPLQTCAFTHRNLYTETLLNRETLHTNAFTDSCFDAQMTLHTHTQKLLHGKPLTHRNFYTDFTHISPIRFRTQMPVSAKETESSLYTEQPLETDALHREAFTQSSF